MTDNGQQITDDKNMIFTKEKLETYVPAFKDAMGDNVFVKMLPFIQEAEQELNVDMGDWKDFGNGSANHGGDAAGDADTGEGTAGSANHGGAGPTREDVVAAGERFVYTRGAYKAVPSMDLVLTPTGFGIVNSQSLVPASKERVSALMESLRRQSSDARDRLLMMLLKTEWRMSTAAHRATETLLFCPSLMRRYGIRTHSSDGNGTASAIMMGQILTREVYGEEYEEMRTVRENAELTVTATLGEALHDALLAKLRDGMLGEDGSAYALVTERARMLMAAIIMCGNGGFGSRGVEKRRLDLLQALQRYEDALPEYKESSQRAATKMERYENKADDPTFFFGCR